MGAVMKLKALRTRLGITQQVLAEKLSTSQQTIARWESGRTPIPTKYLKDLAILLGCSIPELLGVDSNGLLKSERKKNLRNSDSELLYGTLSVSFGSGEENLREWPITEGQRAWVLQQMSTRTGFCGEESSTGWINFETLDDRMVFVNPRALGSIGMVSDDAEESPSFEHEEVYRTIKELIFRERPTDEELDREDSPYSRQLLEKCEALIEEWGGDNEAHERMHDVMVEHLSGQKEYLSIGDEGASDLSIRLLDHGNGDPSMCFVNLDSEGWHRATYFRYGALRLIEISRIRWRELMGVDDEDSDEAA